jgi:hypothetical protein
MACFVLWSLVFFSEGYGLVSTSKSGVVLFVALGLVFIALLYDASHHHESENPC